MLVFWSIDPHRICLKSRVVVIDVTDVVVVVAVVVGQSKLSHSVTNVNAISLIMRTG